MTSMRFIRAHPPKISPELSNSPPRSSADGSGGLVWLRSHPNVNLITLIHPHQLPKEEKDDKPQPHRLASPQLSDQTSPSAKNSELQFGRAADFTDFESIHPHQLHHPGTAPAIRRPTVSAPHNRRNRHKQRKEEKEA